MCGLHITLLFVSILPLKVIGTGTYSAVVVEFSPKSNTSLDDDTNLQNNADKFVEVIKQAAETYQADVIVFPESALTGFLSAMKYFKVPNPEDKVNICNITTSFDPILVNLSCAAKAASAYVVVNLVEEYFNTTNQSTLYFNTDVVFDRNGTIIARYRKINLYGEWGLTPSPNKELVYFDTDFGVRFGLFTCFDMIFKEPAVVLANDYNISHFIFPTRWFSELPFLTGIQESHYWAYSLDVVLLVAAYNMPEVGNTGSGIYLGRQGPMTYKMTSVRDTFLLHADIPIHYPYSGNSSTKVESPDINLPLATKNFRSASLKTSDAVVSEDIYLKREYLSDYETELISPTAAAKIVIRGTITAQFIIDRVICQNSLCCNFWINVSTTYSLSRANISRGDDYSQLYYRMAVFDGVRSHGGGIATSGVQTCAIISCVAQDNVSLCGVKSDSTNAVPFYFEMPDPPTRFYQTKFVFERISITGTFSSNNSLVGPNALLTGDTENEYGKLLTPDKFVFIQSEGLNETTINQFHTLNQNQIVTASIYGQIFSRDGEHGTNSTTSLSNRTNILLSSLILSLFFLIIHY